MDNQINQTANSTPIVMPIKITPAQNRRLHQLLNQTEMMDEKRSILDHFTHGQTESAKELSFAEAHAIIQYLEGFTRKEDGADKMRKKIFAICYTIGWIYGNSPEDRKINQAAIDRIIQKIGYLKKPLNEFTPAQLPKLVSQFEQIEKYYKNYNTAQAGKEADQAVSDLIKELNLSIT